MWKSFQKVYLPLLHDSYIFCLNISGSAFESSGFSFAGIDEISPTEILERNTSPDSGIDTIDVEFTEPKTAVEAIKGKKYEINFITSEPGKDPKRSRRSEAFCRVPSTIDTPSFHEFS